MINIYDFINANHLKQFFINYLKKEGIYDSFMYNFKNHLGRSVSFDDFVDFIYKNKIVGNLIILAFNWSETDQKEMYWHHQFINFKKYLNNYTIPQDCWND